MRRIVYLGGLGAEERLSGHRSSRQEVGRALAGSGVATLELRASIIIGSGSTSFEMIRALVDRLPVMVTPRWVGTMTQPIAIEDVLDYLVEAADLELDGSRVVEIGGPDRVSYGGLMREYARQRGLRLVDFWRVEEVEPDRRLRLSAEMALPGRAWLQFEVEPDGAGSVIRQTAIFDPVGVAGRLHWYTSWPVHAFVFRGMIRGIAAAAAA